MAPGCLPRESSIAALRVTGERISAASAPLALAVCGRPYRGRSVRLFSWSWGGVAKVVVGCLSQWRGDLPCGGRRGCVACGSTGAPLPFPTARRQAVVAQFTRTLRVLFEMGSAGGSTGVAALPHQHLSQKGCGGLPHLDRMLGARARLEPWRYMVGTFALCWRLAQQQAATAAYSVQMWLCR